MEPSQSGQIRRALDANSSRKGRDPSRASPIGCLLLRTGPGKTVGSSNAEGGFVRIRNGLLASLGAILLATSASASALNFSLSWLNSSGNPVTWNGQDVGTPTGVGQEEQFVGQQVAATWSLSWDATADVDPFVNGYFAIQNSSAITQTYVLTVTLPITPAVTPSSLIGGSIGITVTDTNGNGVATVTNVGTGYVFNGQSDATTALQLLGGSVGGFSLSAPFAGGSNTASVNVGLPGGSLSGPAALSSISIQHVFTLTPGDAVGLTSFYLVNAVPEPGTVLLVLTGALGLALLGRRRSRLRASGAGLSFQPGDEVRGLHLGPNRYRADRAAARTLGAPARGGAAPPRFSAGTPRAPFSAI